LGLGIDSKFSLRNKPDSWGAEFLLDANVKYLFKNTQKRTLGLLDDGGDNIPFGYYRLGGENGQTNLFPMANVLTQDLNIGGMWQFEGMAALSFNYNGWVIDLGYDLFVKESEDFARKKV